MVDLATLALFCAATLIFLLAPGPAVLYIVARSVDQGRLAGLVSVLGLNFGALVHVAAAALGLSGLLLSSALAFDVVKYAGAAYLIYLGIQKLRGVEEASAGAQAGPSPLKRLFVQGFLVTLFNPKVAIFFLAFLPQFVDPARGSVTPQILFLGTVFVLMGLVTDSVYALAAGTLGSRLKNNVRFLRAQRYVSGTILIGLGLAAAHTGRGRS